MSAANSGALSNVHSAAEPLSSRNCSEVGTPPTAGPAVIDENGNESIQNEDDAADSKARPMPTTPLTPKGMRCGDNDNSMNTSVLTSPDDHKSPEAVLDADIERLRLSVPSLLSSFRVTQKIGEGTFSTVFKAHPLDPELSHLTVALKHIIPASKPQRTENEVKCLKDIDGRDNVCPVLSCIRENDHIVLVMPHVPHDRFQDYMLDMDLEDVRLYMWNLMLSLRKVHSFNIIHRDVKPANFLFNRDERTFCLVDFGLAHPVEVPPPPIISTGRRKSSSSLTSASATAAAAAAASTSSAAPDFAALRKSPRKVLKPESYSDSRRGASPIKRKLVEAGLMAEEAERGGRAPPHISPRKRQSLDSALISTASPKSPGRRKLSLAGISSIADKTTANKKLFSPPNEDASKREKFKLPNASKALLAPPPPTSADEFLNPASSSSKTTGGRTFKSPRRVLLQKRLADQAESSAPPSLRPRTLLMPYSPGVGSPQQLKHPKKSLHQQQSTSRGPLRATHRMHGLSSPASKPTPALPKCYCLGKPTICSICTASMSQNANRAGTPGFRSPEVLLKSHEQNTAVDIWSAGVIFLSVLSGRYPFFKASTDQAALAQICAIFGVEKVERTAFRLGKKLVCSEKCPSVDLRHMCERLRKSALIAKYGRRVEERVRFPDSAYDLLERMMDIDAMTRITAADALSHPFLKGITEEKFKKKEEEEKPG